MPNSPTKGVLSSVLEKIPSRYKVRGRAIILSFFLTLLSIFVGIFYWPFILKLGLSLPLFFQGRWNSSLFVWTVPNMNASILDTLLIIWGGYCGITYHYYFVTYNNRLLDLQEAWLLQYSPFPNARRWMPVELEYVTRWAFIYMLVHLALATALLLVITGVLGFIATTYFHVSLHYSNQINALMGASAIIWMGLAEPGSKFEFVQSLAQSICHDAHLIRDINQARQNMLILAERERIDRQKY